MNQVNLVGRLTADPEIRQATSGQLNAQFTLAVDRALSKEKKAELESRNKPTADFIRCIVWGNGAETLQRYVGKGQRLGVTGSISTGQQKQTDGTIKYYTNVNVHQFYFLENRSDQKDTSPQLEEVYDNDVPFY